MTDAVDEDKLILCCALCCANCSVLPPTSCLGCSGKVGLCCLNIELCCKPGAPSLPCCCCGPKCENDGCSCFNAQVQCCCAVCSAAVPCNEEVPVALALAGIMVYPKCGCCVSQRVSRNWKLCCYSFSTVPRSNNLWPVAPSFCETRKLCRGKEGVPLCIVIQEL